LKPQIGIISVPLPEGIFIRQVPRVALTLNDNFGMRRQGKPGIRTLYDFNWLAFNASGIVILRNAPGCCSSGRGAPQSRLQPYGDGYRHYLASGKILLIRNYASMLSFQSVKSKTAVVNQHDAIGSHIHPSCVGVLLNNSVACTDVMTAIEFVKAW
jgi:hypothetical protein